MGAPVNAAEHYLEGERLLHDAVSWDNDERQTRTDLVVIAAAQAHFAAAQVGATLSVPSFAEWFAKSRTAEMELYRAAMYGREADDA